MNGFFTKFGADLSSSRARNKVKIIFGNSFKGFDSGRDQNSSLLNDLRCMMRYRAVCNIKTSHIHLKY